MTAFTLHPVLERDTLLLDSLPLSELLLMNDSRFPWCILVPRLAGLSEWHDLPRGRRMDLQDEIDAVSDALLALPGVHKLNVGALGNRVPQLHIHVVGRHPKDPAWPGPVWGNGAAVSYAKEAAALLIETLRPSIRRNLAAISEAG